MSLIGKNAPSFAAPAVLNGNKIVENFSIEQFFGEKYTVLFFYPADFSFVCPTEILEFQKFIEDFEQRDAVVIGCSVDSQFSHLRWLQTPKNEGGIKGVKFPLISDQTLTIAQNFDVLAGVNGYTEDGEAVFQGTPVSYRATFIIDQKGIIRYQSINDLGIGRSVKEILRNLDALIHFEKFGEVCPAEWKKGDDAFVPTHKGVSEYLKKH